MLGHHHEPLQRFQEVPQCCPYFVQQAVITYCFLEQHSVERFLVQHRVPETFDLIRRPSNKQILSRGKVNRFARKPINAPRARTQLNKRIKRFLRAERNLNDPQLRRSTIIPLEGKVSNYFNCIACKSKFGGIVDSISWANWVVTSSVLAAAAPTSRG